jgi:uncharacterized membrane protein HdeD (DUF308 family)
MSVSQSVSSKWGWFLFLGIVSVLAGFFAVGHPLLVTLFGVIFIGASLVVNGAMQIVQSVMTKTWKDTILGVLCGVVSVIGGILIMQEPVQGSVVITLFLLAALVVGGISRIVIAFHHRELRSWWLVALGGLASVVVGIMLYTALPWSGLWVLGTLIGVELIVQGVGWMTFAMDLRRQHGA